MNDDDTFAALCTDMDAEAAGDSAASAVVGDFVDRLRVLLDELPRDPGSALESKAVHPETGDDDTPIYEDMVARRKAEVDEAVESIKARAVEHGGYRGREEVTGDASGVETWDPDPVGMTEEQRKRAGGR